MCVRGDFAIGIQDHDLRNCLRSPSGSGLGNLTIDYGDDCDDDDDGDGGDD